VLVVGVVQEALPLVAELRRAVLLVRDGGLQRKGVLGGNGVQRIGRRAGNRDLRRRVVG
jgi:IMP dehydrogenase/GMP reductase